MKLREERAQIKHQNHFRVEAFLLSFLLMLTTERRRKKQLQ